MHSVSAVHRRTHSPLGHSRSAFLRGSNLTPRAGTRETLASLTTCHHSGHDWPQATLFDDCRARHMIENVGDQLIFDPSSTRTQRFFSQHQRLRPSHALQAANKYTSPTQRCFTGGGHHISSLANSHAPGTRSRLQILHPFPDAPLQFERTTRFSLDNEAAVAASSIQEQQVHHQAVRLLSHELSSHQLHKTDWPFKSSLRLLTSGLRRGLMWRHAHIQQSTHFPNNHYCLLTVTQSIISIVVILINTNNASNKHPF
jgi:hypothetical protein